MVNITLKDLFHERAKFFMVIIGLSVSIIMVNIGIGFINNTSEENTDFIRRNPQIDAFITQENRQDIFVGGEVSYTINDRIEDLDGVKNVEKLIIGGLGIKVKDELVGCRLIGYDLFSEIGPWNIIEGKEVELLNNWTVIVDVSIRRFIPDIKIGDKVELGGENEKIEIVGFCEKNKHWTNPMAWVSYDTALLLSHTENKNVSTVLAVEFKTDYELDDFKKDMKDEDVNVIGRDDLLAYIENEVVSNMGSSIGMLVVVGFFVSMIILAATMYSTVMTKIPELVSMKALGAGQGFINRILIGQIFIYVTVSSILGSIGAYALVPIINSLSVYGLSINAIWLLFIYGVSLNLGILAALLSMRKVKKTDPAVIFRG